MRVRTDERPARSDALLTAGTSEYEAPLLKPKTLRSFRRWLLKIIGFTPKLDPENNHDGLNKDIFEGILRDVQPEVLPITDDAASTIDSKNPPVPVTGEYFIASKDPGAMTRSDRDLEITANDAAIIQLQRRLISLHEANRTYEETIN